MKIGMAFVATLLLGWASPASAQAIKLEFRNGLVSLSAQNAPLRAILAEWTRLGGTKIVNGDRIPGAPITVQLTGVPERQAIDILLRSAAGYIAGPRQAGSDGASTFASIMILPSSAAGPRQASTTIAQPPRLQPPPQRDPEPDDPEDDPPTDIADPDDRPVPANVRQAAEAARQRAAERRQQLFVGDNVVIEQEPEVERTTPAPAANPFGIVPGSVRPGVVIAPPPETDDRRPRRDQEP